VGAQPYSIYQWSENKIEIKRVNCNNVKSDVIGRVSIVHKESVNDDFKFFKFGI